MLLRWSQIKPQSKVELFFFLLLLNLYYSEQNSIYSCLFVELLNEFQVSVNKSAVPLSLP